MEKFEINRYMESFVNDLNKIKTTINPSFLTESIKRLNEAVSNTDFWLDQANATKVLSELTQCKEKLDSYVSLEKGLENLNELIELAQVEKSSEADELLESSIHEFDTELTTCLMETYLSGEFDKKPAILELHPGAGGTESMDWALMLLRMYQKFCLKEDLKCVILDYLAGEEAGVKSVTLQISGKNAYGMLKCERGVHRLVRISPFDSNSRRHTSFASVDVSPLVDDLTEVKINDDELRIDVFHSSGAGGQSVNTTDSAVRITHKPTNIVVSCQNERSQLMNKEQAMRILKSKLLELEIEKKEKELRALKGENLDNAFGSQIRSYVFHPYSLVKDHRTNEEKGNVNAVMDGEIRSFIFAYLVKMAGEKND